MGAFFILLVTDFWFLTRAYHYTLVLAVNNGFFRADPRD
jgi:hypothetical protein